jgi:hypothetical protein
MSNKNFVNGPVNGIRLVGNINGIEKIVYLFGDYHLKISSETKCDSFVSKDFVSHFYETIENAEKINKNTKYDFFFENFSDIQMFAKKSDGSKYRENYIDTLGFFVEKELDIEQKQNKDKKKFINKGSKTFSNLRIHYLDIREFFNNSSLIFSYDKINDFIYSFDCENSNKYNTIEYILLYMINMKMHLAKIWEIFTKVLFGKEKQISLDVDLSNYSEYVKTGHNIYMKNLDEKNYEYYAKKMFEKYENFSVKEKLLSSHIFITIFKKLKKIIKHVDFCEKKIYKLMSLLDIPSTELNNLYRKEFSYGANQRYINKLFSKVKERCFIISDSYISMLSYITDIYLLRRLLDKKYVNNAIVYSGMTHTQNYIYTLVKYFDFKITHCDYSKIDINNLNFEIKNKVTDMSELFLKPEFYQCIDKSKFPENFM